VAKQACVSCGDDTSTDSPLYSARIEVKAPDGMTGFLCGDCNVRITGHDRGRLSDEDILKLREGDVPSGAWFPPGAH